MPTPLATLKPRDPVTYENSIFVNFVTTEIPNQKPRVQPFLNYPMALKKGPLAIKIVAREEKGRVFAGPHRLELHQVTGQMLTLKKYVLFDYLGVCQNFQIYPGVFMSIQTQSGSSWSGNGSWLQGPKDLATGCNESDPPMLGFVQVEVPEDGIYRLVSMAKNSIWEIRCQQEAIVTTPGPTAAPTGR